MEVIIIEDEQLLAEELQKELLAIDTSIRIVKCLTNVADSIEWLQSNKCDLIFSDIELSDGLSFSIFKKLDISIPVVFITAYNKYAIKAFETNSIGYVLKPIEAEDLRKVIEKYKKFQVDNLLIKKLVSQLSSTETPVNNPGYLNRLVLTLGNIQKPVSVDEVVYFMADDRYLFAITQEGKKYYYDATLAQLENELNPSQFFRANRRYFVNKNFVDEIKTMNRSRIEIVMTEEAEEKIVVSYSRSKEFKDWIIS
ncbi:MAG: LytTR family DNA-binding domain-containing protein [Bacteroidales bacterium]|nr:LytTR family DNA-binding domain-containing protein [Bacteroidales bacterium]